MCCRCPGPEWLALRVLWAPWFCSCLPLVSQYAVDALSCMVLHLSPTCPALVSDCLAVCFGFSGPPDSTLVSRLFPTVSQHAVGALGNMSLHLVTGLKIKRYKAEFIYIYIIFVFSVSIIHLIIGVPDFDLYALVSCLSLTVAKYSVGALWSACVLSMLWASGPRGSTLAYPLSCRSGWFQTCLPVSNLAPSCFPSANALWMLWAALASNLSTNISQYAVDALSCMVLRLPPTCLQLGPPVSARVLWVFWAAQLILHLCPPCLPLVSDCLPVCSGCSALFPDCLHGYFGCSVPHEPALVSPLSPTVSK